MKLSEAIVVGSVLGPRVKFYLYDHTTDGSCALGLAQRAMGHKTSLCEFGTLWPWLLETKDYPCPACPAGCSCEHVNGYTIIEHLNDYHDWPLEKIADYVATVEPQELPEATDVHLRDLQAVESI